MLILVGVTVTVAINGGLFEKSKEVAKGTEIGREKEELTSAITTAYDEATGKVDKTKLGKALGTGWSVDGEEDGPYTVKSPKQNIYKVAVDGTITEKKTIPAGTKLAKIYCDDETCTEETHLHKGDYVDYKPTTVAQPYAPDKGEGKGTYTGYTEGDSEQSISQENLNWRVLGKDDNGNILLISGAPTEAGLYFYGYVGYNNYETVLNEACNVLYSNIELGATARSITMDDIDKYLEGSNYDKTTSGRGSNWSGGYGYQNGNEITSKFKYNKETNTLTKEDCTIPAKDLTSNAYYYEATSDLIGAKNREILLGKEEEKTYYNFVAFRAVSVNSNDAAWCVGHVTRGDVYANEDICNSFGAEGGRLYCVRPVVSLPSSVTIEQVSKKDGEVTETWNDPLNKY
jgi:hypothetical protein